MPAAVEPALASLSDTAAPSLREMKAMTADPEALVEVLETMARAGIVLVEEAGGVVETEQKVKGKYRVCAHSGRIEYPLK